MPEREEGTAGTCGQPEGSPPSGETAVLRVSPHPRRLSPPTYEHEVTPKKKSFSFISSSSDKAPALLLLLSFANINPYMFSSMRCQLMRTSWRRWLPKGIEAGKEGTGGDAAAAGGMSLEASSVGKSS